MKIVSLPKIKEQIRNKEKPFITGMDLKTSGGERRRFRLGDKIRIHFYEVEEGHPNYFDGKVVNFGPHVVEVRITNSYIEGSGYTRGMRVPISLDQSNIKGIDLLEPATIFEMATEMIRKMVGR